MSLIIPEAILRQHLVTLGKTGSGKSSALRHVVEHLLDKKVIRRFRRRLLRKAAHRKAGSPVPSDASYPARITKTELGARLGYTNVRGGFTEPLGSLRSLGLIEYPAPGEVMARRVLFLD